MKVEVKESKGIEPGEHKGEIVGFDKRDTVIKGDDVTYFDINIEEEETEVELSHSVPLNVSESSNLGKLLKKFGVELNPGDKVDPEEELEGKKVKFQTINNDDGFAEIKSISPA